MARSIRQAVRQWKRANGFQGPIRGPIPNELIEAVRVAVGDQVFGQVMKIVARVLPNGVSIEGWVDGGTGRGKDAHCGS